MDRNLIIELKWQPSLETFGQKSSRFIGENIVTLKTILTKVLQKRNELVKVDIEQILSVLKRQAIDTTQIEVKAKENTVTLSGKVRSFLQKRDAEIAVWSIDGITKVLNNLEVDNRTY